MNIHAPHPADEVSHLRATVDFLGLALACAIQPRPSVRALVDHWLGRPPISEAELEELAAVWELTPQR